MASYLYDIDDFVGLLPGNTPNLQALERDILNDAAVTIALASSQFTGPDVTVTFKAVLPGSDKTALDAIVASHDGASLPQEAKPVELRLGGQPSKGTKHSILRVAAEKPDTESTTIYSHDWSAKETWLDNATRVVDEVAVHVSGYQIYNLTHSYLIDAYHAKTTKEDFLTDAGGYSYRIQATVNDTPVVEDDPHYGEGSRDYCVDYQAGLLKFHTPLAPTDVVKVTYHYSGSSEFTLQPNAGKILKIELVEVQFASNLILTDSVIFQNYGYVDVFAPHLTPVPFPPGTVIPLGNPLIYKSIRDFQNDALRSYPPYPPIGGSDWRGMMQPAVILDWDYTRSKPLYHSYGMKVVVSLEHHKPFGGDYGTATFYCSEEDE